MVDVGTSQVWHLKDQLKFEGKFDTGIVTFMGFVDREKDTWLLNLTCIGYPSRLALVPNGSSYIKGESADLILEDLTPLHHNHSEIAIQKKDFSEQKISLNGIDGFLWGRNDLASTEKIPPLLVYLHGGPHGHTTGHFSNYFNVLYHEGWRVLTVNYSGSTGYSKAHHRALPGQVGNIDIAEVIMFINHLKESKLADAEKLYFMGGSYSGYQGFEFLQQHPGLFKKLSISNPVTNFLHMAYQTDIPEWNLGAAFSDIQRIFDVTHDYTYEEIKRMMDVSPALREYDVAKLQGKKVLFHLGDSDKRCPPAASVYLYQKLKKQGIDIELMVYPGEGHAIANKQIHGVHEMLKDLYEFISDHTEE
jgi:dipeptidyl aminopeptidase/acylaminoacyl peptidase